MILKFINREDELCLFKKRYGTGQFEFLVIYGRRRIGKTELIKQFIKNKPNLYFLCDKGGTERNAVRFKKMLAEHLNEPVIETNDFEEIFKYLSSKVVEGTVIVLDEFSYLVEKDGAIPSIFQVIVDEVLKNKRLMLILCGSSISMMEQGVLSRKSPLYGRKTGHLKVKEMGISEVIKFFPKNNIEKNIEFYAIAGGIPFYLDKLNDEKTSYENVKEQIVNPRGRLYEEIDFLLKEELRKPEVYKAIIAAIAKGATRVVDIANAARMRVYDLPSYLNTLKKLGIIEQIHSIIGKGKIYTIRDNFFNFWFTFCEPFRSDLEIGNFGEFSEKFRRDFNAFIGQMFEKMVRKHFNILCGKLGNYRSVGKWWGYYREKNERKVAEIDLVALNEPKKEILFGECKWQENVNAKKVLKELKEKTKKVQWHNEERKEIYVIFAKSFKEKIKSFEGKRVYCFDLGDFEKVLRMK